MSTTRNSVLLDNEAYSLLINGDLHGWREALPKLEAHLQRAETLLREGVFSELELLPLNGHVYRLNRWRLRQFWRRGSSLAAHFFPS
ncbi:MAG: hypothetical protein Q9O24_00095 [Gammaproteobacteria bacterium]|nr:hypothetical protein [Gammaproteobacteria bacterium]